MKYKVGDLIKTVSEDKMKELTPGMFNARSLPIPKSVLKMEEEQLLVIKKISSKEFEIKSTEKGQYCFGDGKSIFKIEEDFIEGYVLDILLNYYCQKSRYVSVQGHTNSSEINHGYMNTCITTLKDSVLYVGDKEFSIGDVEISNLAIDSFPKREIMVNDIIIKSFETSSREIISIDLWFCKSYSRCSITKIGITPLKEPPLGLVRLESWEASKDNERTHDILQAMLRYSSEEKPFPREWVKELSGRVINLMDGME